jgi:hypothetical protein
MIITTTDVTTATSASPKKNKKRGDDLAGGNSGMSLALLNEATRADVDMSRYQEGSNQNHHENHSAIFSIHSSEKMGIACAQIFVAVQAI